VAKKQEHCDPLDPADDQKGDWWDHKVYDPEHRLVLAVVPGARNGENAEEAVDQLKRRTEGRDMNLITSDEHRPYKEAILRAYGVEATTTPCGHPVRAPHKVAPPGLCYAAVQKVRRLGRVVAIVTRLVFGTAARRAAALSASAVSRAVHVSFLERQHLTDRHRNARKRRKTYCFSKDWEAHEAATYFTLSSYNFCWPVRTLRTRSPDGSWQKRTPAMAAGLTDHIWSLAEWLRFPAVKRE
jgi:IS1 family transposase